MSFVSAYDVGVYGMAPVYEFKSHTLHQKDHITAATGNTPQQATFATPAPHRATNPRRTPRSFARPSKGSKTDEFPPQRFSFEADRQQPKTTPTTHTKKDKVLL